MSKRNKIIATACWVLFGLSSTLIIAESCVPTGASGQQSFSFSRIVADFFNWISPPKPTVTVTPSDLTVSAVSPSATFEDGSVRSLFGAEEAVIGTTKMFQYRLDYPDQEAQIKDSAVSLKCLEEPSEDSYTLTFTPGAEGGQIRLIPLEEGQYRFRLTDASNHEREFAFLSSSCLAPKEIESDVETLDLKKGQTSFFPFAMSFGDMTRSDGSLDHYLARYFDRRKARFSSSDETVLEVKDGGVVFGKKDGFADILYDNKPICRVNVSGEYASEVASISLESEGSSVSPLDYDYLYGQQLKVHYFNSVGAEIDADEPILFESSDPLIAKVDSDHLEKIVDAEDPENVSYKRCAGGFVSGYRKQGEATIKATLAGNPLIHAERVFSSSPVAAESVTITAKSNGRTLSLTGEQLTSGDSVTFQAAFYPANAGDQRIHIDVSDESVIKISNNDSNSPSIHCSGSGDAWFRVYSLSLGETSAVTYRIGIAERPQISDDEMADFHGFIRKAAGHFALFLVTSIFGAIAVYLTFFTGSKWWLAIDLGLLSLGGFSLAGLSELIQAIPALRRGASMSDVGIDTLGFFLGSFIVGAVFLIRSIVKKRRSKKDDIS